MYARVIFIFLDTSVCRIKIVKPRKLGYLHVYCSNHAACSSSLMTTQESRGKPWSIGTRNWMQPDQWAISIIRHIKLKIRMNTPAIFRNCNKIKFSFTKSFVYGKTVQESRVYAVVPILMPFRLFNGFFGEGFPPIDRKEESHCKCWRLHGPWSFCSRSLTKSK